VKSEKIEMDQADRASAESKCQEDIAEFKSSQDELLLTRTMRSLCLNALTKE